MKKQILKIGIIAFTLIMGVFVWQSCSNDMENNLTFLSQDKEQVKTSEEVKRISKSSELKNYMQTLNNLEEKFADIFQTLSEEEQKELFNNVNKDEYVASFFKKNNLENELFALSKEANALEEEYNYSKLSNRDQITALGTMTNFTFYDGYSVEKGFRKIKSKTRESSYFTYEKCKEDYDKSILAATGVCTAGLLACGVTVATGPGYFACAAAVYLAFEATKMEINNNYADCIALVDERNR